MRMINRCINCGKDYELKDENEYSKSVSLGFIENTANDLHYVSRHGFMICDNCYEKMVGYFMDKWEDIRRRSK